MKGELLAEPVPKGASFPLPQSWHLWPRSSESMTSPGNTDIGRLPREGTSVIQAQKQAKIELAWSSWWGEGWWLKWTKDLANNMGLSLKVGI